MTHGAIEEIVTATKVFGVMITAGLPLVLHTCDGWETILGYSLFTKGVEIKSDSECRIAGSSKSTMMKFKGLCFCGRWRSATLEFALTSTTLCEQRPKSLGSPM